MAATRNSVGGEEGVERQMRFLRAHGSAELEKVASECYAGHLAGRQKKGISGDRQRPKPTPWEGNSQES